MVTISKTYLTLQEAYDLYDLCNIITINDPMSDFVELSKEEGFSWF